MGRQDRTVLLASMGRQDRTVLLAYMGRQDRTSNLKLIMLYQKYHTAFREMTST